MRTDSESTSQSVAILLRPRAANYEHASWNRKHDQPWRHSLPDRHLDILVRAEVSRYAMISGFRDPTTLLPPSSLWPCPRQISAHAIGAFQDFTELFLAGEQDVDLDMDLAQPPGPFCRTP